MILLNYRNYGRSLGGAIIQYRYKKITAKQNKAFAPNKQVRNKQDANLLSVYYPSKSAEDKFHEALGKGLNRFDRTNLGQRFRYS